VAVIVRDKSDRHNTATLGKTNVQYCVEPKNRDSLCFSLIFKNLLIKQI